MLRNSILKMYWVVRKTFEGEDVGKDWVLIAHGISKVCLDRGGPQAKVAFGRVLCVRDRLVFVCQSLGY